MPVWYYDTAENIGIALKSGGGNYLSLAFLAVVGNTVTKRGMFKAPSSAKTSVSFTDAAQGTEFWYYVLNFLIWGVEEESSVIPGLETEELSISYSWLPRKQKPWQRTCLLNERQPTNTIPVWSSQRTTSTTRITSFFKWS